MLLHGIYWGRVSRYNHPRRETMTGSSPKKAGITPAQALDTNRYISTV